MRLSGSRENQIAATGQMPRRCLSRLAPRVILGTLAASGAGHSGIFPAPALLTRQKASPDAHMGDGGAEVNRCQKTRWHRSKKDATSVQVFDPGARP